MIPISLTIAGLLINSCLYSQQAWKDTSRARSDLSTGGAAGASFPLGNFKAISGIGFHSASLSEWQISRHLFMRGILDFSTYSFSSTYQKAGFTFMQQANRTIVMALINTGYRCQLGRWIPALYIGNGLAYYTEPVLQTDINAKTIHSIKRTALYYALHTGFILTYILHPSFKPFVEVSVTYFPKALITGNTFFVFQPTLGIKVPLKGITNAFKLNK